MAGACRSSLDSLGVCRFFEKGLAARVVVAKVWHNAATSLSQVRFGRLAHRHQTDKGMGMKLTINGVGAIESSVLEISSLTLIAGENDTGKSTIGKIMFAIVQAFSKFPIAVGNARKQQVRRSIDRLYFILRDSEEFEKATEIKTVLSMLRHAGDIKESIPAPLLASILRAALENNPVAEGRKAEVQKIIDDLTEDFSGGDEIGKYLFRALRSEFAGSITRKPTASESSIVLSEDGVDIVNIKFNDRKLLQFNSEKVLNFKDATLVDGPSILQYFPAVLEFNAIGEKRQYERPLPYHTVDLANKLRSTKENADVIGSYGLEELERLFNGRMRYDRRKLDFLLQRNGADIPSDNVASGLKALSVISLLIRGDYVGAGTVLVLDEPETNLHPVWQMAYAKVIASIAAAGAKVLVASHSPYIIEALKVYTKNLDGVKFYFSYKDGGGLVKYQDTHGDIAQIIHALAKPLADLLEGEAGDDF